MTNLWGMVAWKIVEIQLHDLSQTSSENLWPLQMTKFSRQFVPDLASCSLSEARVNVFNVTLVCQTTVTVWFTTTQRTPRVVLQRMWGTTSNRSPYIDAATWRRLRWMCGVTRTDKVRNQHIREWRRLPNGSWLNDWSGRGMRSGEIKNTYWGKCWGRTYQGKRSEDDRK